MKMDTLDQRLKLKGFSLIFQQSYVLKFFQMNPVECLHATYLHPNGIAVTVTSNESQFSREQNPQRLYMKTVGRNTLELQTLLRNDPSIGHSPFVGETIKFNWTTNDPGLQFDDKFDLFRRFGGGGPIPSEILLTTSRDSSGLSNLRSRYAALEEWAQNWILPPRYALG